MLTSFFSNNYLYIFLSEYLVVHLTISEILLFSATLCASDAVAALTMIKYEESPRLFSVIFGEGIVNDAVAIILF